MSENSVGNGGRTAKYRTRRQKRFASLVQRVEKEEITIKQAIEIAANTEHRLQNLRIGKRIRMFACYEYPDPCLGKCSACLLLRLMEVMEDMKEWIPPSLQKQIEKNKKEKNL